MNIAKEVDGYFTTAYFKNKVYNGFGTTKKKAWADLYKEVDIDTNLLYKKYNELFKLQMKILDKENEG